MALSHRPSPRAPAEGRLAGAPWGRRLAPAVLAAALLARPAVAQEPAVIPPKKMVTVLLKVLAMDTALTMRGDGDFVVAVPWERGQEAERDRLMEVARPLEKELTFRKRPIRFVPVQLKAVPEPKAAPSFREALVKENASTVLVPVGVSKAGLGVINQVARDEKLHTLAMDASQVEDWLSVGVIPDDTAMKVLLNANCVRAAGGFFEVTLLKVSKIYHYYKDPRTAPAPPSPPAPPTAPPPPMQAPAPRP